jgi:cell division septum initiation protein DivIVA
MPRLRHTRVVAGSEPPHRAHDEREPASPIPPPHGRVKDVRDPLPEDIRDPSFPAAAVHGYSRRAVDGYVERVNTLIAELQVSGSPRAAVRHALDRVGEQTSGILQHARETAEEITASAREEAEATTARAKAEAHDITADAQHQAGDTVSHATAEADHLVAAANTKADEILVRANDQSEKTLAHAQAEAKARIRQAEEEIASLREDADAQLRSLQADIAAISDERHTLLDDVRQIAARLQAVVADAEPTEHETPPDKSAAPEPGDETTALPKPPAEPSGAEIQDRRPQAANPGPRT